MNYFQQLRAFRIRQKLYRLDAPAVALWYTLMAIANETGLHEGLSLAVSTLAEAGLSKSGVQRARNTLQQKGYLTWRSRRGRESAVYDLADLTLALPCGAQGGAQGGPQAGPQAAAQSAPQAGSISLQNQTEQTGEPTPLPPRGEEAVIFLPATGDAEVPVTQAQAEEWARLYPAVDVAQALRNMRGWLQANPQRRKAPGALPRFVAGWLAREQSRGGTRGPGPGAGAVPQGTRNPFAQLYREEHGHGQG